MNSLPPPLPAHVSEKSHGSFPRIGATLCLAAPIFFVAFAKIVDIISKQHSAQDMRWLVLGGGGLCALSIAVGSILGFVAMLLAQPGERRVVFGRAGVGLLLSALFMAIAVPSFVRARSRAIEQKEAMQEVKTALKDFQRDSADASQEEGAPIDSAKLQRAFGAAAEKSSGDQARALKAAQTYMSRLQACRTALDQASLDLKQARVLYTGNLTDKHQIEERRQLVQNLLNANDALRKCFENAPTLFREALVKEGVSSEGVQTAVGGFIRTSNPRLPLILEVRTASDHRCRGMLGALSVLDANWNRWRYDKQTSVLRFDDTPALQQYNRFLQDINKATADEAAASERLVAANASAAASL